MAKEFRAADLEVTYQFTGRPQDKFFDMEVFNGHQWREGLTFSTHNGKINHLRTVLQSRPLRFFEGYPRAGFEQLRSGDLRL